MLQLQQKLDGFDLCDPMDLARQVAADNGDTSKFLGRANSYRAQAGRNPGIGYVLVPKKTVAQIIKDKGELVNPVHYLDFSDGERAVRIDKLAIIKAEAIHGNYPTDDATPFLLTLVDRRHFASDTWQPDDYGLIKYDGEKDSDTGSHPLNGIWSNIRPLLGNLDNKLDYDPPAQDWENILVGGGTAWDAWWSVLDTFGMQFTVKVSGQAVIYGAIGDKFDISAVEGIQTPNSQLHADAAVFKMSHWADHQAKPYLPETVVVVIRLRDYQWWDTSLGQRHTPQDHHRRYRYHEVAFDVFSQNLSVEAQQRIVPNTVRVLWAPYSLRSDDTLGRIDQDEIEEKMKDVFTRYLETIESIDWLEREYIGVWPFEPTDLAAVRWADYGDGMFTKTWDTPFEIPSNFDDQMPSWNQELVRPGPSTFVRDTEPHARSGYGIYEDTGGDSLEPGKIGTVKLQSGRVSGSDVTWTTRASISAVNATNGTIGDQDRVVLDYNYQLGEHGKWCIINSDAAAGGFVGVVLVAIDGGDAGGPGHNGGEPNVGLLTLVGFGYTDKLDEDGNQIEIHALNMCAVTAEVGDLVAGHKIEGHWFVEVLCCPPNDA